MFKRPRSDFWRVGIVPAPIAALVEPAALAAQRSRICWLPPAGPWRYLADPFGLPRGDALHVFVEAYDYRSKHAVIERHEFGAGDLRWRAKRTVLARPFHLSYPYVFEHQGEVFMVPESHQANEIALYKARGGSLDHWERQQALLDGLPGADASLIEHAGRWWMFYTVVGSGARDQRELHVAHAPDLRGPWQRCAGNPLRVDRSGARPAGRPFVGADGCVLLPVQDSSQGYGSATRWLRFTRLEPDRIEIEALAARLSGELVSDDYQAGLHTVSACGPWTLIDVKRVERSRMRQWLDFKRRLRRLARRFGGRPKPAGAPLSAIT
ncbi:glucosamine inositolphosphorylceramide transferase family protein [Roseateles violae]|uniref:Glucosamine inositolphosphorylceramide transferase 1 N-terminal domain-containing protein n=1 Tax=Roseateles violae TaxID=3058042 RepID=A0ABT8DQH6_9BURK|nr:hypothetical protein [Pelomonas sp. PFR6]MDN3919305.1 hypothetical protein [Pelomonas sp. PFR6]